MPERHLEPTFKLNPLSASPKATPAYVSLLVNWGENVRAFAIREGQVRAVGRAAPSDWVLEDSSLSRMHARIRLDGGLVTIEDLGSTNGCRLNGALVTVANLAEGDVALLGTVELRIAAHATASLGADVLSHAGLLKAVADEIARARLFGRPLSVVAVRHTATSNARKALQGALSPVDRLCMYAPTVSLVLLPERDASAAKVWLGGITWIEGDPCISIASYPLLATTPDRLVSSAIEACLTSSEGDIVVVGGLASSPNHAQPLLRSPCMMRLYDLVNRAARTTLPVLVEGETGSGKEFVARALHERSQRSLGPFKALNCATIPVSLLESVLFGHERGAFTGADKQAPGIFEQAHQGTVFLDEVGELSPQAQAALLRTLETRVVVRLGSTKEVPVDVRIVAATHRSLAGMVQAGTFREDLMFRLDALTLRVPPLRERGEEILPLAELFLARAHAQWGATAEGFSQDAIEALQAFSWAGNVRQLRNVVERAVVVCSGSEIQLEDLPAQLWSEAEGVGLSAARVEPQSDGFRSLPQRVRDLEVELLREALAQAHGNQSQAARLLGVPRRTLASKVHAYGLLD